MIAEQLQILKHTIDMKTAIYPGTFDPVTNGHMDIITRGTRVVDQLIIGVAINIGKGPLFSVEERVQIVEEEIKHLKNSNY